MRRYSVVFVCLLLVLQLAACSAKTVRVDGFSAPESVTSDGTYFYVSNVGEKLRPMDKDGDGYISRLSDDGKVLDRKFISGLNAPKGMAVLGGVLYVTDIDHIKGFEVVGGKQVFDLDFSAEGTSFLNDITLFKNDKLLVSAMDIGALYQVSVADSPSFTKVESNVDLFGPNGLCYDPETETLYIVSFGKDHKPNGLVGKGRIENGRLEFEKIYSKGGFYDGVAYYDGKLLFSDWVAFEKAGVIIQKDLNTGKVSTLKLGEKIGGPADFYLDVKGKRIWIPMMMENKVLITGF